MPDTNATEGRTPLPAWGEEAREFTKKWWQMLVAFWALGLIIRGVAWLLGADDGVIRRSLSGDLPGALLGWLFVVGSLASLLFTVLGGIVWLAGSAVAGYREPRT